MNFNNKSFQLRQNSNGGQVNEETIFKFYQEGCLITADYKGGGITYGKIIALMNDNLLEMIYQCLTEDKSLLSRKAQAKISHNAEGKIRLDIEWRWLESDINGVSHLLRTIDYDQNIRFFF